MTGDQFNVKLFLCFDADMLIY